MLRRLLILSVLVFLAAGCGKVDRSPVAIEIDGIKITVDEFEEMYRTSYYAKDNLPASRKAFLDNLLVTKLILREAERMDLDKDPVFLKEVEFFWQQSLLKLMLDVKSKEVSLDLRIDDREIRDYYELHKDTDFEGKALADVYGQIQWLLLRSKQRNTVQDWMNALEDRTEIKINYGLLDIEK